MEVRWQKHPTTCFKQVTIPATQDAVERLRRLFPGCDVHNPPWPEIIQELLDAGWDRLDLEGQALTSPRLLLELEKSRPPSVDDAEKQLVQFAAAVGDENAAKILEIAQRRDWSGNDKMAAIIKIDRRYEGWKSSQWADLLKVSDGAVRGYEAWKKLRARHRSKLLS